MIFAQNRPELRSFLRKMGPSSPQFCAKWARARLGFAQNGPELASVLRKMGQSLPQFCIIVAPDTQQIESVFETIGKIATSLRPRSRRGRSHPAAPTASITANLAPVRLGSWSEERTREKEGRKKERKGGKKARL